MQSSQVGGGGQLRRGLVTAQAGGAGVGGEPGGGGRGGVPGVRGHRPQLVAAGVRAIQNCLREPVPHFRCECLGDERSDRARGLHRAGDRELVVLVVLEVVDGRGARVLETGGGRGGAAAIITLGIAQLALQLRRVNLLMLPEAGGVSVGLVTAPDVAVVRLVCGVHMHVLLTITGVSESSVTPSHLAFKRLLT